MRAVFSPPADGPMPKEVSPHGAMSLGSIAVI
jgi:hypothetical protein